MRNTIHLLFIVSILLGFMSCENNNTFNSNDCDQNIICYTEAPDELFVKLELSESPDGNPVIVRFYEGNVDDGVVIDSFSTYNLEESYLLPVNEDYSAEATYGENGNTIIAIDGERLSRESFQNCNTTCYDWDHTITLDLKLE
jgi:hypothetical protein